MYVCMTYVYIHKNINIEILIEHAGLQNYNRN